MAIIDLIKAETPVPEKQPYVTVTRGMRGWFARGIWWNPEFGGFWEPWQTSPNSWEGDAMASIEGRQWAEAEGLKYKEYKHASAS